MMGDNRGNSEDSRVWGPLSQSCTAARWPLLVPLSLWIPVYVSRVLLEHYSLQTNAYDLSVFDYALWTSLQGSAMYVPFYGHSLLANHAMPTLWALLPIYAIFQSPVTLLVLQLTFVAGAATLLWRLAAGRIPNVAVAALIAAFLFSRGSHGAIMSMFYIDSLEPLLVFAMVLAAARKQWRLYWISLVLALGCKEDMAIYIGAFCLILALTSEHRRVAVATAAAAVVWFVVSLIVVMPAARDRHAMPGDQPGLDINHPVLELNYGTSDLAEIAAVAIDRIASWSTLGRIFNITSSVLFTCFAAPVWLLPAAAGLVVDLTALPGTQLADVTGHYLYPIMPWVFIAGLGGLQVIHARWPRRLGPVAGVLVLVVLVDWPGWRHLGSIPVSDMTEAASVRAQLDIVPENVSVLAQANLIPHLRHRMEVAAVGGTVLGTPSYVLLTAMGDTWPLDRRQAEAEIDRYRADSRYELLVDGPLFAFRLRGLRADGTESP